MNWYIQINWWYICISHSHFHLRHFHSVAWTFFCNVLLSAVHHTSSFWEDVKVESRGQVWYSSEGVWASEGAPKKAFGRVRASDQQFQGEDITRTWISDSVPRSILKFCSPSLLIVTIENPKDREHTYLKSIKIWPVGQHMMHFHPNPCFWQLSFKGNTKTVVCRQFSFSACHSS